MAYARSDQIFLKYFPRMRCISCTNIIDRIVKFFKYFAFEERWRKFENNIVGILFEEVVFKSRISGWKLDSIGKRVDWKAILKYRFHSRGNSRFDAVKFLLFSFIFFEDLARHSFRGWWYCVRTRVGHIFILENKKRDEFRWDNESF